MASEAKLAVIGQGYVGRPLAMLAVEIGHRARVGVVDEHVATAYLAEEVPRLRLMADSVHSADAVVMLTDHHDIGYELLKCEARWILDCRDRMSGANVESL